jgi:hypothetical protein
MLWSGQGMQVAERMQSRGIQRAFFPAKSLSGASGIKGRSSLGIVRYGLPVLQDYRPSIKAQREAYPAGPFSSGSVAGSKRGIGSLRMGSDRPWYEALFSHIENMTVTAGPMVMQILDMSFDQARAGWQHTAQKDREQAYLAMIGDMASQRTGTGTLNYRDPQMRNFTYEQFMRESSATRNQVLNQASGGDPALRQQLNMMMSGSFSGFISAHPFLVGGVLVVTAIGVTLLITKALSN